MLNDTLTRAMTVPRLTIKGQKVGGDPIPGNLHCAVLCLVAQSSQTLCNPMDCSLPGFSDHGDSPGKNTGEGGLSLLQGIFLTQE